MCPSRTISVRLSSSVSPVTYIICALLFVRSRSCISMRYHRLSSGQKSSARLLRSPSLMSAYVSNLPGPYKDTSHGCDFSLLQTWKSYLQRSCCRAEKLCFLEAFQKANPPVLSPHTGKRWACGQAIQAIH